MIAAPLAAVETAMGLPTARAHLRCPPFTESTLPRPSNEPAIRSHSRIAVVLAVVLAASCDGRVPESVTTALEPVTAEVVSAVSAFHAADIARNAEAVIDLLWPEFSIMVDGQRQTYDEVVAGSRQFMATLDLFHTEWTDLRVTALTRDNAIASFQFRDSIIVKDGTLIRARGPTTFVWQRRNGEWRVLFADADHYPIDR